MRTTRRLWLSMLLLVAGSLSAQVVTVLNGPLSPGGTALVQVDNTQPGAFGFPITAGALHLFRSTGELVHPFDIPGVFTSWLPAQGTTVLTFNIPPSGPGSAGSYVLHFAGGSESVTRLDVGTPSAPFPMLHCWPARAHEAFFSHALSTTAFGVNAIKFSNVGSAPHLFGSSDALYVFRPDLSTPLQVVDLEGLLVSPGEVVEVSLNVAFLTPGPLRVLAVWSDPWTAAVEMRNLGLRRDDSRVDLGFPEGRVIPQGGTLPYWLALEGFSAQGSPAGVPFHAFMLSWSPGRSWLAPGLVLPLDAGDALLQASLSGGLSTMIPNASGQSIPWLVSSQTPGSGLFWMPYGVIVHPGQPMLSGLEVHAAAVAYDPVSGILGVSQGEVLVIE